MNLLFDVAKDLLSVGGEHLGYEYIANTALELNIDPSALLTFGLTALTVSQLLLNLPTHNQDRLPFIAHTPLNKLSLWMTANTIGAVFGKYITNMLVKSPLSWTQTIEITVSKVIVLLSQRSLIAALRGPESRDLHC